MADARLSMGNAAISRADLADWSKEDVARWVETVDLGPDSSKRSRDMAKVPPSLLAATAAADSC